MGTRHARCDMVDSELPYTQVKILRFADFKPRDGVEFVAHVLSTNATLTFRLSPGYMLDAAPGQTIKIHAFASTLRHASRELTYVPLLCKLWDPTQVSAVDAGRPCPTTGHKRQRLF